MADLKPQAAAVALELALARGHGRARGPPRALDPARPGDRRGTRRRPAKLRDLGDIRGVKGLSVRRLGPEILAAVERGLAAPPVKVDRVRTDIPPDEAGALVSLADALLRARAHEAGLAFGLIAARAELLEVVMSVLAGQDEPRVPMLDGWRRELVGAEVLELLRGRGPDGGRPRSLRLSLS